MGNHAKESINPTKHKVELPNSKTINIEGTNFKYEVHYDQLDDKDLLMIEKYANHIFRAYQEKYGLDVSTDYTFKGFIYNSLTDLRNARPGHNTAYAGASFHHYPHKSGSVAHDLTEMIYFTLNFYNKQSRNIPIPKGNFIRDVEKELKAIRLDDNQEESNTAEKPETTINQEEPKKIEPSDSREEEKIKLDEEKSGQEKISPETMLPDLNNLNDNQEESNTEETSETTINQEEPKKIEPSGEDEKSKVEGKKSGQEEISPEEHQPINQEESNKVEPSGSDEEKGKVEEEKIGQEERSLEEHQTINQEESKKVESSGSEEEKSSQEEINPETMLPHSKIINIEGTNFKLKVHYDQLDDKDLLTIEARANSIFHAYQERNGLDMNKDYTFDTNVYDNYLSNGGSYLQEVLENQIYYSLAKAGYDMY